MFRRPVASRLSQKFISCRRSIQRRIVVTHRHRRTAFLAVAAGVSVALTACASSTPAEPTGTGSKTASTVKQLTIPVAETPWLPSYQKIIADYKAETGVDVVVKSFPFDGLLTQEANAAQSGSNAFDVFQLNEQWVGQFYDNQWVQPLTDVDPSFSWDQGLISFDGVGQWDADARTTSPKGVPYSLPINGNIQEFMYRTDLYDQLGLKVPTTWDQVVSNGKAAKDAGAVDNGYVLRGKTPTYDFSALLFTYGGKWFTDELGGDWTPAINTPEGKQAIEEFKALADIGPAAPQTVAQAEATSLMQAGKTLQATLVAAVAAPLEDPAASLVAGKIGYAVLPGQTPVSGTWTLAIPTGLPADRAQAAYAFMTWLTSKDAQQKWVGYGGVTTRSDITSDRPEIQTIVKSADKIRGGMRYPFTPALLDVLDPILGQYVAGTVSTDDALKQMDEGMTKVVKDAGFLS